MAKEGRPPKYGVELLKNTQAYIDESEDTDKEVNLPSVEGLAYHLDVSKRVLYDWEQIYPEFLHLMDRLRAKQARVLLNKGLSGKYNPTIAKVLLTKHDYREGIEQTGAGGKDLIPERELTKEDQELLTIIKERDRNSRTETIKTK